MTVTQTTEVLLSAWLHRFKIIICCCKLLGILSCDGNQSVCFLVQDKAEPGCVGQSCLSESKEEGITADEESGPVGRGSTHLDGSGPIGE